MVRERISNAGYSNSVSANPLAESALAENAETGLLIDLSNI